MPDSPHAVSVCLPTWRDVIGYEEGDDRVCSRLRTGYPRFVFNRFCRELFDAARVRFANDGEDCLVFSSPAAAERCVRFLRDQTFPGSRVTNWNAHGAQVVTFPREAAALAKAVWQHGGDGITSRQAQCCLEGKSASDGRSATETLRHRLAEWAGVPPGHVFLYPSGMSAFAALHRAVSGWFPDRASVQFGFPYVDSLKIQQKFGTRTHFLPQGHASDLSTLGDLLAREPVSAVFTEFPSNPLLLSPDLERLARLTRRHDVPLLVDDTLAGFANVDLLPVADAVCTSLTKFVSGVGDVTGGSVVINPRSAFATDFVAALRDDEAGLWGEDAIVLERNSRDYPERMARINANAERLAAFLSDQSEVAAVHYPNRSASETYQAFLRPGGGYGGLLSIDLHDAASAAPPMFDALRVSKGPNLGTDYTLACPYTLLAHYGELEFVESCGVSRHLIRVSIGLESPEDLEERLSAALQATRR